MVERNINAVMVHDKPGALDFSVWRNEIDKHPASMLPVTDEALRDSFDSGAAAVIINTEGEIVGGTRFTSLLDKNLIAKMGLTEDTPEIVELGSIVTMGEGRGNGYSLKLNQTLIDSVLQKIADKKLLVIGTTKTVLLLKALAKLRGVEFTEHSHEEFKMIEPLTCVCTGEMGCGFQTSADCPARIKPDQVANLRNGLAKDDGKIPCTLFVSDKGLAIKIEETLRDRFAKEDLLNPQKAEVEWLKGSGYYK